MKSLRIESDSHWQRRTARSLALILHRVSVAESAVSVSPVSKLIKNLLCYFHSVGDARANALALEASAGLGHLATEYAFPENV